MTITLTTDGGPHPADKWASLTAGQITQLIQIDDQSGSDAAISARKAKPRFAISISDSIETAFSDCMNAESLAVKSGATEARNSDFQVGSFIDDAMSAVLAAAQITPFAEHFSVQEVQSVVRNIITQNILDAANIARSWAFDAKGL